MNMAFMVSKNRAVNVPVIPLSVGEELAGALTSTRQELKAAIDSDGASLGLRPLVQGTLRVGENALNRFNTIKGESDEG